LELKGYLFQKFEIYSLRQLTKYQVKVCEVGEASQHSEKLRGECKFITGVPENERKRE